MTYHRCWGGQSRGLMVGVLKQDHLTTSILSPRDGGCYMKIISSTQGRKYRSVEDSGKGRGGHVIISVRTIFV